MYPAQQRAMHHHNHNNGWCVPKINLIWLLIITLMLYIVYSSDLFVSRIDKPDCVNNIDLVTSQNLLQDPNNTIQNETEKTREELEEEPSEDGIETHDMVTALSTTETSQIPHTELKHVVFGIAASSKFWNNRKEYIKTWWRPGQTRGVVWLDRHVTVRSDEPLPQIQISSDTSEFKYKNRQVCNLLFRLFIIVQEISLYSH